MIELLIFEICDYCLELVDMDNDEWTMAPYEGYRIMHDPPCFDKYVEDCANLARDFQKEREEHKS